MKTTAAILTQTGKPLKLVELDIPALKHGQALVEIRISGVCHTQVLEARGHRGPDAFLPHCLGHEGSGTVLETGGGVNKIAPGDRVVLSWIKGSGADVPGTVYRWNGADVNAGGITTFSRHAVISENRLTKIPEGLSMEAAALLGCATATGMGAVMNTGGARPGMSAAVFGAGGVGLCAVAAAAAAGCAPVIAVDKNPARLAIAAQLGATHCINTSQTEDVAGAIQKLVPGGLDLAVEASGRPALMALALECVRARGGAAVIVGNARHGETLNIDPRQLNLGKRLLGTWGGDTFPDADFPRYAALVASGKARLDLLLSEPYPLRRVNDALDDLESGRVPRPIIDMSLE